MKSMVWLILSLTITKYSTQAKGQDAQPPLRQLTAAEVLPAEMLKGDHYYIDEVVYNDGLMNYFTIHSSYGDMTAHGRAMLATRLNEVRALDQLKQFSESEIILNAAIETAAQPFEIAIGVLANPIDTAKGIPGGVSRFFKKGFYKVGKGLKKAGDLWNNELSPQTKDQGNVVSSAAEGVLDLAGNYIGIDNSHRRWAQKLRVDPYSSNQILQENLKRIARYDSAGALATRLVPVKTEDVVDHLGLAHELVWEKDGDDLAMHQDKILKEIGADKATIQSFRKGSAFSPTQQTLLLAALDQMKEVSGRDEFLNLALAAKDEMEANLFRQTAEMMAQIHTREQPLETIAIAGRPFGILTKDGAFLVVAAVDRVFVSESLVNYMDTYRKSLESTPKTSEVRISGTVGAKGKKALSDLGYVLTENAALSP